MSAFPHRSRLAQFALLCLLATAPACWSQAPASSAPTTAPTTPPTSTTQTPPLTPQQEAAARRARADAQLKLEEKQRILGLVPNFNTVNMQDAVPLTPKQKFQLMYKSSIDPAVLGFAVFNGALGQAEDDFQGYGQGWGPYGQRVGASFADTVDGNFWGNAVFPILLHEDPRYYRKGTGNTGKRMLYSIATTFRTRSDDGRWVPNYGNIAGNLVSGGISNLYYPSTDRGVALTFTNAATVTAEGALGALFFEFWPDISRKLHHKRVPPTPPADLP